MTKLTTKSIVPSVTRAVGLAGRAIARLEDAAAKAMRDAESKDARSLRLVSQPGALHALIKSGKVTIQIEGDSFAVVGVGDEQ
jgi:hypothetical protein